MAEPTAEEWEFKAERNSLGDWEVVGFRRRQWFGQQWGGWSRHSSGLITGLSAGPAYWFKPMDERVQIAARRIKAAVYREDALEREKKRLSMVADEAAREPAHATK